MGTSVERGGYGNAGAAPARGSLTARDRWRQTLQDLESAVAQAVEMAIGEELGRVPRQTRLQMLKNALRQGLVKVDEVDMQQTLQDLKKSSSNSKLPPSPGGVSL